MKLLFYNNSQKRIRSLQFIRFIAFLMIFWHHTGPYRFVNIPFSSSWAVSVFIVMSGLLYGIRYQNVKNEDINISIDSINAFFVKKIKKFYPLHLATLMFDIPLSGVFVAISLKNGPELWRLLIGLIKNLLLIQDWFIKGYFEYNGVTWFLSLMMFLIIVTLPLIKVLKRYFTGSVYSAIGAILLINAVDVLYTWSIMQANLKPEYFLYILPISRLAEYVCGLLVGLNLNKCTVIEKAGVSQMVINTSLEIVAILLVFASIMKCLAMPAAFYWHTAYIVPNCILLLVFAKYNGLIARIIENKYLVYLGNISFECFMIHQVLFNWYIRIVGTSQLDTLGKFAAEMYLLGLTIVISAVTHRLLADRMN